MFQQLFLLPNDAFDDFNHTSDIPNNFARPEANDVKRASFQPCCATRIVRHLIGFEMLVAIDLDDEANGQAHEIREVRSYRKLAAEPVTADYFSS